MRKWINFPRQEGINSRQAHADFPEQGIYERELGRSGFFGPATQCTILMYLQAGLTGRGLYAPVPLI